MKKILRGLLILSCCFIIFGCSDDDKDNLRLSLDQLKQTTWNGNMTVYVEGKVSNTIPFKMFFKTDKNGTYTVLGETKVMEFDYKIDDKLIIISGNQNYKEFVGDWVVTSSNDKTITLRKNITNDNEYSIMELTKTKTR